MVFVWLLMLLHLQNWGKSRASYPRDECSTPDLHPATLLFFLSTRRQSLLKLTAQDFNLSPS